MEVKMFTRTSMEVNEKKNNVVDPYISTRCILQSILSILCFFRFMMYVWISRANQCRFEARL